MATESKAVRLRRLQEDLDRAETNLRLAVIRRAWKDAKLYAERAVDLEARIVEVEAEPDRTNGVA